MYRLFILKRSVEALLIFPFALLGRLIAYAKPLKEEYDIFCLFPFYHIGGAEKVHSEIVQLFPGKKIVIFFTRKSVNGAMLDAFKGANIAIHDVSRYTDDKLLYFNNLIWRGVVSGYIRRQHKKPVVFNGQCNFAYKLAPHLPAEVKQVELIHSFCSFSYIRIPFIKYYHTTLMISRESIQRHLELYERYKIPAALAERIRLVMNGIPLPENTAPLPKRHFLLYVGRGTAEKRVHLVAAIARAADVTVGFLGQVRSAVPEELHPYCEFYGELTDSASIDLIYRQHRVIVITSEREGFPMVIMEGMARGLGVLATDVGDIPFHVKDGTNGYLIDHHLNEAAIVQQGAAIVKGWKEEVLGAMSANNIEYARNHFGIAAFAEAYRSVLI